MKIVIYGAGDNGRRFQKFLSEYYPNAKIVAFLDKNPDKANKYGGGYPVLYYREASMLEYDYIIISVDCNLNNIEEIKNNLYDLSISEHKVISMFEDRRKMLELFPAFDINDLFDDSWYVDEDKDPLVKFTKDYARFAHDMNYFGNVAEAGVYRGHFSHFLNKFFPEKNIYLFDTFEGFDERDIAVERGLSEKKFLNSRFNEVGYLNDTSVERVLRRLPYPEKCIVKKGFFPDSAQGLEDVFCFVRLDMDLYQPTLEGLRFFYDKMVSGGLILLHDYFYNPLPGVKRAVEDYEAEIRRPLTKTPIGDSCSLAIIKQ